MLPARQSGLFQQIQKLPRNVWSVSLTSFFMDVSSEMVLNLLPLYLTSVLGLRMHLVGLIEGLAETTASLLKLVSGWVSDWLGQRKWLAVVGYALSAVAKPGFALAASWGLVAAVRWVDRVGKGLRTAPRDALIAESISGAQRGLAFGFHRAADTLGAALGLLISILVVQLWGVTEQLEASLFRTIAWLSVIPASLAVITLWAGAREVRKSANATRSRPTLRGLGRPFTVFICIAGLFELGNSSDAFLILRAEERGLDLTGILTMLLVFNLVYALASTPAGILSDRLGRRRLIIGGWLFYALIYLGFGLVQSAAGIWLLYILYGLYYGLAYGTARALVADLVPVDLRGTAYGAYNAVIGLLDLPASLIAGLLWQGVGSWAGFGPAAPFFFGAALALAASLGLILWQPASIISN